MRKSYLYATPSFRGVSPSTRADSACLLKQLWPAPNALTTYPGQGAPECALAGAVLFQLMVMVTGVEWLSEPDVPVTINVT